MPFNQAFSVPTRLTLHTTGDGIRMFAHPVREPEKLRKADPKTVGNRMESIEGRNVHVSRELLEQAPEATTRALELLTARREEVARVVPRSADREPESLKGDRRCE